MTYYVSILIVSRYLLAKIGLAILCIPIYYNIYPKYFGFLSIIKGGGGGLGLLYSYVSGIIVILNWREYIIEMCCGANYES